MRRLAIALMLLVALAFPAAASAHPSEHRSLTSTFGGPHCHILTATEQAVYPSHRAHVRTNAAQGTGNAIFTAVAC